VTAKPVLAVPLEAAGLTALDSLQATTRGGPPVASLAIGKAGATNAALLAVAILANADEVVREKLEAFRTEQTAKVLADTLE
jgi:5-(carboxyamino)imidazole ribonucleotide mutase